MSLRLLALGYANHPRREGRVGGKKNSLWLSLLFLVLCLLSICSLSLSATLLSFFSVYTSHFLGFTKCSGRLPHRQSVCTPAGLSTGCPVTLYCASYLTAARARAAGPGRIFNSLDLNVRDRVLLLKSRLHRHSLIPSYILYFTYKREAAPSRDV